MGQGRTCRFLYACARTPMIAQARVPAAVPVRTRVTNGKGAAATVLTLNDRRTEARKLDSHDSLERNMTE